jgi:hypothetical protein
MKSSRFSCGGTYRFAPARTAIREVYGNARWPQTSKIRRRMSFFFWNITWPRNTNAASSRDREKWECLHRTHNETRQKSVQGAVDKRINRLEGHGGIGVRRPRETQRWRMGGAGARVFYFSLLMPEAQGRCLPGVGQEFAVAGAGRQSQSQSQSPAKPSDARPALPSSPSHHIMALALACAAAPPPCPARTPINEALIARHASASRRRRGRHGRVRQVPAACERGAGSTPATSTDSVLGRLVPFLLASSPAPGRPPPPLLPLSTSLLPVLTFSAFQAPVSLATASFPAVQSNQHVRFTLISSERSRHGPRPKLAPIDRGQNLAPQGAPSPAANARCPPCRS